MQPLFQSTFLQALGFGIANSLWQTALIGLLVFLANKTLSLKASAKYRLAVFAQLTSFLWFIITIRFYSIHYNQAWQISSLENASGNPVQAISWNDGTVSSLVYNGLLKAEGVLPYISLAYLLLLVFLCFRWISCYRATQELRNSGLQKIPVDWRLFVKKTAAQLGIHKEIRLFLSEKASTPVTMGFLKPVILLPLASINHLSSDQMEAVLLHELAHIKRYDYLLNLILSLTEISLFSTLLRNYSAAVSARKESIAVMTGFYNFSTMPLNMQKHCCGLPVYKPFLYLLWGQPVKRMNYLRVSSAWCTEKKTSSITKNSYWLFAS